MKSAQKTRTNLIFSSVYVSDESVRASHLYERSVNLCKLHDRMNMLSHTHSLRSNLEQSQLRNREAVKRKHALTNSTQIVFAIVAEIDT